MVQAQVKKFPGYGVVYPDGVSGVKVIHTYTQGSKRMVNPDGSVSFTTPPPVIHELLGGGFAYADGSPVKDRTHLETIGDVRFRERALRWFDSHGDVSAVATEDVPPLDLDKKERPEPVYVLSKDLPADKDEVTRELDKQVAKDVELPKQDTLSQILTAISSLAETVKEQGEQIIKMKTSWAVPKKRTARDLRVNASASERLKARWKDPDFRAKMSQRKKVENGVTESGEAVQTV